MKRALVIVVLALATYANALGGSFHFDDGHAIEQNPSIRSLANTGRFFSDASAFSVLPQNQGYRPLLLLSYAATAAVAGVEPRSFLAVNLAVHVVCALLLWAVLRRTLRLIGRTGGADDVAWLAAAIFAVHPLFSECVNYVSARSESLTALFMLASLYAWLRGRDDSRWVWLSALAAAAGLLTKPVAAVLPALMLALELAAAERAPLRRVGPKLAALGATVLAFTLLSAKLTPEIAFRSASSYSRAQYLRSELPAIWHYARLFVWPAGQSADPDYPVARSFTEPRVLAGGLALLACCGFAAWGLLRRRGTATALAIACFLLCLLPSSSIVPLAEIVNEHRPYLAAAALCALAAGALVHGVPRLPGLRGARARAATAVAALLVLAPLAAATVARNRVWRNAETLWADVVAKAPDSARAHTNYGMALEDAGKLPEAESHMREAVRLRPRYSYAHMNLGNLLLGAGRSAEALVELDQAIALDPTVFWAHYSRGLAADALGEPPATRRACFEAAVGLAPTHVDAWYRLALARDAGGDATGAVQAAQHAVALRGSWDDRFLLASLQLKRGNAKAAHRLLTALRAERPEDERVTHNLELAEQSLAR